MTYLVERLRTKISIIDMLDRGRVCIVDTVRSLVDERDEAAEAIIELTECLRELHDLQNGPPLPSFEERWSRCMGKAAQLLKQFELE